MLWLIPHPLPPIPSVWEEGSDQRVVIYRGPGFLAVLIWLLPHPLPLSSVSKLDWRRTGKGGQLADGRGGREWGKSKIILPPTRKSSINQSILSIINTDIAITGRRFIYFIIQFRDGVDFVSSEY
jgi:hypothetical protein